MREKAQTVDERLASSRQLTEALRGGPAAAAEPAADLGRRSRPAEHGTAPARDVDLVLGVLDEIAADVRTLCSTLRGPTGEGTRADARTVAAPAAGAIIAQIPAPGSGRYRIRAIVAKDAGAAALDLALRIGPLVLAPLLTAQAPQSFEFDDVHLHAGDELTITHPLGAAGTFTAFLSATRVE